VSVPVWAWAAFAAFVVVMLALDLFVLHRRAHVVSLREAALWTAVWLTIGLGFGGLLWAWAGGGTAQAYLAGYLRRRPAAPAPQARDRSAAPRA
jgi:tellurite resistance protein TerC